MYRQSHLCPPTMAPTGTPTFTMPPTFSPSVSPSVSPTVSNPTVSPSVSPSVSPTTSNPTKSPTMQPTVSSPTVSPTVSPTPSPTPGPTASPTMYCLQYNYTHTTENAERMCPSIPCTVNTDGLSDCAVENGPNFGPAAVACKSQNTARVQLALANGMFGGADGEAKSCEQLCLWDAEKPEGRSYKWTSSKSCWSKKNTKKCGGASKEERMFAADRKELTCLIKAPIQQIEQPPTTTTTTTTEEPIIE